MNLGSAISTATDFISGEESFSSSPYFDVNGYAIGFGNHYYEDGSPVTFDDYPITRTRALEILTFYVNQNATAILSQVSRDLNSNQLASLISLRYNCGTITETLLSLINSGADNSTVSNKLRETCITSGGIRNSDLIDRRAREGDLYETPPGISVGSLVIAGAVALFAYVIILKK